MKYDPRTRKLVASISAAVAEYWDEPEGFGSLNAAIALIREGWPELLPVEPDPDDFLKITHYPPRKGNA
jgi:hypothetical protein